MKYDTWHKEILSKFASRLGDNMQDFYGTVSKVIKLIITSVVVESTSFEDCNGFFCPSWNPTQKYTLWYYPKRVHVSCDIDNELETTVTIQQTTLFDPLVG